MSDASNIAATLNDKHLRLWGNPLSVFAILFAQMSAYFPGRWDLFGIYTVISIVYTGLQWEVARWALIRIRLRYPGIAHTRSRIFATLLIFSILVGIGQFLVTAFVVNLPVDAPPRPPFWYTWSVNYMFSLFFVVLISGFYEAQYFFSQYRYASQKTQHLKKQQAQQQLDTLKNRVNPHFLFNSLTTLSALIGENQDKAERFVNELAKVYRYLLRAARQQTASVEEELLFADSYCFLFQARFEESGFTLQKDSLKPLMTYDNLQVPTLALQTTLDYLIRTQHMPLHVRVQVNEKAMVLSCQHHPKSLAFDSGHELQYMEQHGIQHEVVDDQFVVTIPINQNTIET